MSTVGHYENFPVASLVCSPHLRKPIVAIYHFARTADDIADEGDALAAERLDSLQSIRRDLLAMCTDADFVSARWSHVLNPLHKQIQDLALPVQLLLDLLDAFEQDVVYTRDRRRYTGRAELLDYCTRSANPIGRLLLHLYSIHSTQALAHSDAVCSSLQLINFWQDLSVDIPRGRLYLPADAVLREEIAFARQLMEQGAALVHQVPGRAGWELRLVVQGGLRILDKIEATDTLRERPRLHALDKVIMLLRSLWMRASD
ncbi:MAG: squalene synthase HpnC [Limnohabitans sp.]|nr:squalene synthase HpnC [Limnohabitans sp.]